jgi:hypothetical protein
MCGASNLASGNFHCPDLGGSRLTDSSSRFYFWKFSVSLFADPAWCHGRAARPGLGSGSGPLARMNAGDDVVVGNRLPMDQPRSASSTATEPEELMEAERDPNATPN